MAYNQFSGYGATLPQDLNLEAAAGQADAKIIMSPPAFGRQRVRMNIVAIFLSIFLPWALFSLLFADVSFRLHFRLPALCWGLVLLAVATALGFGAHAGLHISKLFNGAQDYKATWYVFLFLTSGVAVVLGTALGDANFWNNMQPYYSIKDLNTYNFVDPTRMHGEQMMDAGLVEFLPGAMLDLSRAYAFQNVDTYCVAPITMYNPGIGGATPLNVYDFWAVGLNCCGGDSGDPLGHGGNSTQAFHFKCGPFKSRLAHQGLRLMAEEQRSFFRLAVQQAESARLIKADHPLFFHWELDAETTLNSYLEDAFKMFTCWMCGFFAVQLALVLIVTYMKSRAGHGNL